MKRLSVVTEYGYAEGYEVDPSKEENAYNFLSQRLGEQAAKEVLAPYIQEGQKVAIIKNLQVREDRRGKGEGTKIFRQILEKVTAPVVFLEADTGESNAFDLVSWYESYGFEKLPYELDNPIMILR